MNKDHSVIFETAPSTASQTCVDYEGYSISSKGFLPTVVDIMVIWIKATHPVHFSSLIPKMSLFILAVSCLTTSNLLWFMDLTFQVPMQYYSLQHWNLLPSPVTSTGGCCFCFGSVSSFFLELFLHWSPVEYWAPTNLRRPSFCVLSLCLFILFMWFSRQEHWSGLPFPSPVNHILSEPSTMTPWHMEPPKMDGSWWRGLTLYGPLEKEMANHFSILALRSPWRLWKGKKDRTLKDELPGQ